MKEGFLEYEDSRVHFLRFGKGTKILIALHGFADQASIFLPLAESLEKTYTIYSLDLPFHGKSEWNKPQFTAKDFTAIFEMILKIESKERFDLMGFSLGGRIVQTMLFESITKLDNIYLIAPYEQTALSTIVPQGLKNFISQKLKTPNSFLKFIKIIHDRNLINRFQYNFIRLHLRNSENRDRLFGVWRSLHYFKFNSKKLKTLLNKSPININFYFGKQDKIISKTQGEQLSQALPNVHMYLLESDHSIIGKQLNILLNKQLN